MFPDVPRDALSALLQPRRRSSRIMEQQTRTEEAGGTAPAEEMCVTSHLEAQAQKWMELNQLRRVVYVELHNFLSSFHGTTPRFAARLKDFKRGVHISKAVILLLECGVCPDVHVIAVGASLERALELLMWRPIADVRVKRMQCDGHLKHVVNWDTLFGSPSDCLAKYQGFDLRKLLRPFIDCTVDGILRSSHTEASMKRDAQGMDICALCIDELSPGGDDVTTLSCGHHFHTECMRCQMTHAFIGCEQIRCGLCREIVQVGGSAVK